MAVELHKRQQDHQWHPQIEPGQALPRSASIVCLSMVWVWRFPDIDRPVRSSESRGRKYTPGRYPQRRSVHVHCLADCQSYTRAIVVTSHYFEPSSLPIRSPTESGDHWRPLAMPSAFRIGRITNSSDPRSVSSQGIVQACETEGETGLSGRPRARRDARKTITRLDPTQIAAIIFRRT